MVYECFEKNKSIYECVISPNMESEGYNETQVQFHVILKLPGHDDYLIFRLYSTGDGHWCPDKKKLIDPWVADAIGRIIVENF
jgi:hypothetical protein